MSGALLFFKPLQLKKVTSGAPQGSILGPILVVLYVKRLPHAIKHSKQASFADDKKLFGIPDRYYLRTTRLLYLKEWFLTVNKSARTSPALRRVGLVLNFPGNYLR